MTLKAATITTMGRQERKINKRMNVQKTVRAMTTVRMMYWVLFARHPGTSLQARKA